MWGNVESDTFIIISGSLHLLLLVGVGQLSKLSKKLNFKNNFFAFWISDTFGTILRFKKKKKDFKNLVFT